MAANNVIKADSTGQYLVPISKVDVAQVHFADIDLIVRSTTGQYYVLVGAAMASMDEHPPVVKFLDAEISSVGLFKAVVAVDDPTLNTQIKGTDQEDIQKHELDKIKKDLEERKKHAEELQHKLEEQKDQIEKAEKDTKELEQAKEQIEVQEREISEAAAKQINDETVQETTQKIDQIIEDMHSKDYDYVPPREYQPPPAPFAGPSGVPAPISMTPLVLLSMGNVVGTEVDTSVLGVTTLYGGGGAVGSSAADEIGPRDVLQFSSATITGTSGNDVIYATGASLGNASPATDTSHYAKEFLLQVAGYFTELNDIVFKGLPSYVSVQGGTLQADGSWVLPKSYVISQQSFTLVYDKDAWRAGGDSRFDMTVVVSGLMRGTEFSSEETFGFQFMDVTDVSQSTDPYLTFWADDQSKQIYVLPTMDQPTTITADSGDDVIYGGRSHDTIDAGSGNDTVWAYDGDNVITGGDGNDTVHTGTGDDTINVGQGNNVVDDTGGANILLAGDGDNTITMGAGDDTLTLGDGHNVVNAGDGANTINAGDGDNQIDSGTGADTIVAGSGDNVIHAGDGNNTVTVGDGNSAIVTGSGSDTIQFGAGTNTGYAGAGNDVLYGGSGDDTLYGEAGDDRILGGVGTNLIDGGSGSNTVDYSTVSAAVVASLASMSATAAGLSDTYVSIQNITGSSLADTLTGDINANILSGGAGNDTLSGGGGADTLYGNEGDDALTGGSGNDVIDGGAGNDTISGASSGTDILRGGEGDDIFLTPSLSTSFDGGVGTDKVDYSAQTSALTIDLLAGTGYIGGAQISTISSVEWIVGGSGADALIGSNGDDILDGGAGNDSLRGNLGHNTLIGGTGSNYYYMGYGYDYIAATGTANWDEIHYESSTAGVVVNLDTVSHSFVNNLGATVTVSALSGTSRGETASDAYSYSVGDTYASGGIDYVLGSNYDDVVYGNPTIRTYFYGYSGSDTFFGGSGNDMLYVSVGNDKMDGSTGTDTVYVYNGTNMTTYLDGTVDINGNGIADYIDKSATGFASSGYTGFVNGWSGTTLLANVENIIGASGNDYLVGNSSANEINAQAGNNTVYGLGGDDLIFAHLGNNTIDGGTGTDTVSFRSEGATGGWGYNSATSVEIYLADADLDSNGTQDKAGTWGSYASFTARTNTGSVYSYSTISNVENINGSVNADKIAGNASANIIRGDAGNDFITGNGGADSLYGDAGNDVFVVQSTDLATITLVSGGTGSDTIKSAGWAFTAGSISNTKFANIETIDARNSASGSSCSLTATDVQSLVDSGASSVVQLYLDSGDTFTATTGAGTGALSVLNTTHTATDDVFKLYSDAGHTTNNNVNLVAIINVHYGV